MVDVPFSIYLSSDTQVNLSDHNVYSSFVDVGAGLSTSATIATDTFDLTGVPDGDYFIGAIADPNNVVVESDDTNNKAFEADTFAVGAGGSTGGGGTTPTGDSYEPDDTSGTSTSLTVGSPQIHSLLAQDIDWYIVSLIFGTTYVIETYGVGGQDVDTYVYLFLSDGATIIDEDDDGGSGTYSQMTFSLYTIDPGIIPSDVVQRNVIGVTRATPARRLIIQNGNIGMNRMVRR